MFTRPIARRALEVASCRRSTRGVAYLFLCSAFCCKGGASYTFTRRTLVATTTTMTTVAASEQQQQYWNRELSAKQAFDLNAPITKEANVLCIGDPTDAANSSLYQMTTTERTNGLKVLAVGDKVEDFDAATLQGANVIFVSYTANARQVLSYLLREIPSIEWVHARSAGIDFIVSDDLTAWVAGRKSRLVTNAKGAFSSTLAEYTLLACSYFAKDLPRLMRNKNDKNWRKYPVKELRGSTLGVVGYGDIGKAAARLANAYGMKVQAMKRRKPAPGDEKDPIAQTVYGNSKEELLNLFSSCDYILCSMPLTSETEGMIGKAEFDAAKDGAVFINVGRGPIVDEKAMIEALQGGRLKGVGLDVFTVEPLPKESPLWSLDNVLLSPHNMDMTETFMQEATDFFLEENLPRFVRERVLLNPVDPVQGY